MTDVGSSAKTLLAETLDFCGRQMGIDDRETIADHLRQGNSSACNIFFSRLGKLVAEYLGTLDEDVRAVYLCDLLTTKDVRFGETRQVSPVRLIVWTRRKTAALNSLVAAIDRALVQGYADLIRTHQLTHLLDAQMMDDSEVKSGSGYGGFLFSLNLTPTQIWKREGRDAHGLDQVAPTHQLSAPTEE